MEHDSIRIFRREDRVSVLGPGVRAVIWVQGCSLACPNCIVPESWDHDAGESLTISSLADWYLSLTDSEGLTISGGEPMLQAKALCELIGSIRRSRDVGIVCYTGFTYEHLVRSGTPDQQSLLGCIDLLIDGAYIESKHASLLWRGSANQRLMVLSPRYAEYIEQRLALGDVTDGVEFSVSAESTVGFVGVPPVPGFRADFEERIKKRGVKLA